VRTKPLHVAYTLVMFTASVYLDHHWIFDGLAGWTIAGLSVYVAGKLTAPAAAPDASARTQALVS
jgi:membrane-associated phospholipid phosphatase